MNGILNHLFTALPKLVVAAAFIPLFAGDGADSTETPVTAINRVISLSPAISRQISDLGEEERIVGVTSWDDLSKNKGVALVGNLIQINMETIVTLKPDMIFFSREDSAVQRVEKIQSLGLPYRVFPRNHDFRSIEKNYLSLARMLNREKQARSKLDHYRRELKSAVKPAAAPVIAFFVSYDPLIPATRASHIHNIITDAGARNAFGRLDMPYPAVSLEEIVRINPDIIILLAHGTDTIFSGPLRDFKYLRAVREGRVFRVSYDSFCSYTPADYVASVKILSGIIAQEPGNAP